jgi:hypothetical protein
MDDSNDGIKRTFGPNAGPTRQTITAPNNQTIRSIIAFSFVVIICGFVNICDINANRSHSHTSKASKKLKLYLFGQQFPQFDSKSESRLN